MARPCEPAVPWGDKQQSSSASCHGEGQRGCGEQAIVLPFSLPLGLETSLLEIELEVIHLQTGMSSSVVPGAGFRILWAWI